MSLRTRATAPVAGLVTGPAAAFATAAVLTLTACASNLDGVGHGSGAPAPVSSSAAPATASAPASTVAPVSGAATPCPQSEPQQAFACLQGVLSTYWSGQLNQVVTERIVVDAVPAQAPPACRPGIEAGGERTCRAAPTI